MCRINKPKGRGERNELLEILKKRVDEIRELDLPDRMWLKPVDYMPRDITRLDKR